MAKKKRTNAPQIKINRSPVADLLALGDTSIKSEDSDLAGIEKSEVHLDENMLDFSSAEAIEEALNSKDLVGKDLRIDDSSLPQAKNFYEFATSPEFIATTITPYLEQALIGIKTFAEYCPRCSNTEWMKCENHEAQEGLAGIEANVVLMEYGVCPECGAGRSELFKTGELNFYDELALNAGQRGGKSAVVAMLAGYVTHRVLKMQKPAEVFGFASNTILHGTFCAITKGQAKENLWDPYYGILLDTPWFCLAEGTSISMADGSHKPIEQMLEGDCVKTFEGSNTVAKVFDNGFQECKRITLHDGKELQGTDKHKVRSLAPDGVSLVWKRIGDITEDDFVVVED